MLCYENYLSNGLKIALSAIGIRAAHMNLKPCDCDRHHNHKHIFDPWALKAFPMFPQKNLYRCRECIRIATHFCPPQKIKFTKNYSSNLFDRRHINLFLTEFYMHPID